MFLKCFGQCRENITRQCQNNVKVYGGKNILKTFPKTFCGILYKYHFDIVGKTFTEYH